MAGHLPVAVLGSVCSPNHPHNYLPFFFFPFWVLLRVPFFGLGLFCGFFAISDLPPPVYALIRLVYSIGRISRMSVADQLLFSEEMVTLWLQIGYTTPTGDPPLMERSPV